MKYISTVIAYLWMCHQAIADVPCAGLDDRAIDEIGYVKIEPLVENDSAIVYRISFPEFYEERKFHAGTFFLGEHPDGLMWIPMNWTYSNARYRSSISINKSWGAEMFFRGAYYQDPGSCGFFLDKPFSVYP